MLTPSVGHLARTRTATLAQTHRWACRDGIPVQLRLDAKAGTGSLDRNLSHRRSMPEYHPVLELERGAAGLPNGTRLLQTMREARDGHTTLQRVGEHWEHGGRHCQESTRRRPLDTAAT